MAPGTTHWVDDYTQPAGEPGEGRDASEAGRVLAPAHLADRARHPLWATPLHPSAVPALTSGRDGAGCGGCWGAPSCLSSGIRGGQRQQGHPRSRCSWLVAPRALRPRPRRRLPPSPLRGLRAGTQLTPWPRSPPPLHLPGADGAASSAAPRAAGPAAASAAQRPAPGSPPPPASPPRDPRPAVTQAACPGTPSPAESTRRRDQPARAAARRWGLS